MIEHSGILPRSAGLIKKTLILFKRTLKFKIGFVPQNGGYFHDLTVYQTLKAIAEITIKNLSYREEKINNVVNLKPKKDRNIYKKNNFKKKSFYKKKYYKKVTK